MNKVYFLSIVLIAFSLSSDAQLKLHEWSDAHYKKYKFETFKKLKIVNQKIDNDNVDHRLLNAAVFYRLNSERLKLKMKRLIYSPGLEKSAQKHSENEVKLDLKPSERGNLLFKLIRFNGINSAFDVVFYVSCETDGYYRTLTYWELADDIVRSWVYDENDKKRIFNSDYKYGACGIHPHFNNIQPEALKVFVTFIVSIEDEN